MPNILDTGKKLAVQEGLKEAEQHPDDLAFSATTDGEVEVEGKILDKGRLSMTAFAAAKLRGAKDFAAGVRGRWNWGKKD